MALLELLNHHLRVRSRLSQKKAQCVVSQRIVRFRFDLFLHGIDGGLQVWKLDRRVLVDDRLKLFECGGGLVTLEKKNSAKYEMSSGQIRIRA